MKARIILTHLFAVLMVGLVAAGCAAADHPLATDKVQTAAEAIEIGKRICRSSDITTKDYWTGSLHKGIWQVRHVFALRGEGCRWEEASVRATDGESTDGLCSVCVTAT